jgi:hypothetical protein
MLIFVASTMQEARIPEIGETEEEKQLSIGQLKHRYLQFAKQCFQGKVFTNKDTGKPIKVAGDSIREWWVKSRRREHIISIQILDVFLENSVLLEINPDYKGRLYIENSSRFQCECKINDYNYRVLLTTRKAMNDNDKLRYYSLENIEVESK